MNTTMDMHMSVTPMNMTYSSVIKNYRNTINQRFPNEYASKTNNRRIQTTASCGGGRGGAGRVHQGHGGRGRGGEKGRVTVRINYEWEFN